MTLAAAVVSEVRRRLTARNMSQNALARAAGIAPTLLHRTMLGQRDLTLDEFASIAAALDLTPAYLLRVALNAPASADQIDAAQPDDTGGSATPR